MMWQTPATPSDIRTCGRPAGALQGRVGAAGDVNAKAEGALGQLDALEERGRRVGGLGRTLGGRGRARVAPCADCRVHHQRGLGLGIRARARVCIRIRILLIRAIRPLGKRFRARTRRRRLPGFAFLQGQVGGALALVAAAPRLLALLRRSPSRGGCRQSLP